MRNCPGSAVGILAINGEENVKAQRLLWPEAEAAARVRFANAPGPGKARIELISRLVTHCGQNLSEDEVPRGIVLVGALGGTPEGHVDPLALLASNRITAF
jgi:hypothetical protein